jgi:hypothetical protein
MVQLGFALLTHARPQQTLRLVKRLGTLFDDPPIVCHHDFSKCDLDVRQFPSNVRFVRPHHVTAWGNFSLVDAAVAALRTLYRAPKPPDWFTFLSGADYPVAAGPAVLRELEQADVDAFMHHELIDPNAVERNWHNNCLLRYYRKRITAWYVNYRLQLCSRRVSVPMQLSRWFLPFSPTFRCFAGSQWFTANHRCAERILAAYDDPRSRFNAHYRCVPVPDESYFQCLLCNDPGLRIRNDNKRFTDWVEDDYHPKILDAGDLPRLLSSGCHFARKFDPDHDGSVLNTLDELLG